MERIEEGIDIGVGTQIYLMGYHCQACGEDFATCDRCGGMTFAHLPWCADLGNFEDGMNEH
jgi:hypothetical protein